MAIPSTYSVLTIFRKRPLGALASWTTRNYLRVHNGAATGNRLLGTCLPYLLCVVQTRIPRVDCRSERFPLNISLLRIVPISNFALGQAFVRVYRGVVLDFDQVSVAI